MKKQDALDRLNAIEKEQKELRKIIEDSDKPKEIIDIITGFKEACDYLNLKTHADAYKLFNMKRNYMKEVPILECEDTYLRLCIYTLALNEGKIVDFTREKSYFPYFNMNKKPGSGFYDSFTGSWHDVSCASARLALRSSKLAVFSGQQFEQEHYNYMYN